MTDADLHREEWIEERAGILEFEAGIPRQQAEVMARRYWLAGCRLRTIVAGGREGIPCAEVERAMDSCPWAVDEVVTGGARGVDTMAYDIAWRKGLPVKVFPADWATHGKAAGPIRNRQMLDYADALIAVWDGKSRGTANMVSIAKAKGVPVHEVIVGAQL